MVFFPRALLKPLKETPVPLLVNPGHQFKITAAKLLQTSPLKYRHEHMPD